MDHMGEKTKDPATGREREESSGALYKRRSIPSCGECAHTLEHTWYSSNNNNRRVAVQSDNRIIGLVLAFWLWTKTHRAIDTRWHLARPPWRAWPPHWPPDLPLFQHFRPGPFHRQSPPTSNNQVLQRRVLLFFIYFSDATDRGSYITFPGNSSDCGGRQKPK